MTVGWTADGLRTTLSVPWSSRKLSKIDLLQEVGTADFGAAVFKSSPDDSWPCGGATGLFSGSESTVASQLFIAVAYILAFK